MSLSSSATPLLVETEPLLKTGLQSVLRSLDVGLEDELARYRRKKRLQQSEQARASCPVTASPATTASQVEEARGAIAQLTQSPGLGDKLFGGAANATEGQSATAESPIAEASETLANPSEPTPTVSLGSSLVSLPQGADTDSEARPLASASHQGVETPLSEASEMGGVTAGLATLPDQNTPDTDNYFASSAALLESLASYEEEPAAEARSRSAIAEKLLTPTGVVTSMLVLLGSATAGYLMLHPESLSHLQLSELLPKQEATPTLSAAPAPAVDPELPPGAPDLSQREFIDLTLSNLGRLNLREGSNSVTAPPSALIPGASLGTSASTSQLPDAPSAATNPTGGASVVTIGPPQRGLLSNLANAVAGTPVQAPAPVPAAQPSAIRLAPETPLPTVAPAAVNLAPPQPAPAETTWEAEPSTETSDISEPQTESQAYELSAESEPINSETAPLEPIVTSEPVSSPVNEAEVEVQYQSEANAELGTFVVVTPYKSDLALSQVQQFAPDAYVRNTEAGAVIQVGIHDSAETANSVVEQLQREGLNAYVE